MCNYSKKEMQALGFIFPGDDGGTDVTRYISKRNAVYEFISFSPLWENSDSDIYAVITNTAIEESLYEPYILFWHYGARLVYSFDKETIDDIIHSIDLIEELHSYGDLRY